MRKVVLAVTALVAILMAGTTLGADLIAGNPKNGANVVGQVMVEQVNGNLVVTYTTTGDAVLTETHLHIATLPDDIPQSSGNPNPGGFQYSDPHGPVTEWTYTIPLVVEEKIHPKTGKVLDPGHDWITPGTTLYIAAHGVVEYPDDCDELVLDFLPDEVTVSVTFAGAAPDSYFDALVSGGTVLDGLYDAWCIDTDKSIRLEPDFPRGTPLQALVFSSYEDGYDNMDLVNWILNNIAVGDPSSCTTLPDNLEEYYTYGDIQRAIWELVADDSTTISGLGPWSPCRVNEIKTEAWANGIGYVPNCGEVVAIILQPYVVIPENDPQIDPVTKEEVTGLWYFQPIIITIPAPCCGGDDTVWAGVPDPFDNVPGPEPDDGDGYKFEFPGDNWAMYFTFTVE